MMNVPYCHTHTHTQTKLNKYQKQNRHDNARHSFIVAKIIQFCVFCEVGETVNHQSVHLFRAFNQIYVRTDYTELC